MPFQRDGKRDVKAQLEWEHKHKPEYVKHRAMRNAARKKLMDAGVVKKGDGKDVDHKTPISKGGGNSVGNLRAVPASKNRSVKRKANGSVR